VAAGRDGGVWFAFSPLGFLDGTWWHGPPEMQAADVVAVDVAPDGTVWYSDGDGLRTLTP
jgi:hypothetical protein